LQKSISKGDPCRQRLFTLPIIGEVPVTIDLNDDNKAKEIIIKGFQYAKSTLSLRLGNRLSQINLKS